MNLFGIYTRMAFWRISEVDEPAAYAESFMMMKMVRLAQHSGYEDFGFDLIYAVVLILITMAAAWLW